jgi:signal transduction histidine kinase
MKLTLSATAKTVVLFYLLSLNVVVAAAQTRELDQLHRQLALSKDSLTTLHLLNRIGFIIHMKSADSTFYYGVRASRLADRLQDDRGKADATANIAIGLALKGMYSQSLSYYSKAYLQYQAIPDTMEMAQMLMNSAISYSFTADSEKTKALAEQAIQLTRHQKPDSIASMLYANYVAMTDLPKASAAAYLNKAEIMASRFKDDRSLLFIQQLRAQQMLTDKQYPQARQLIQSSLDLARKHQWEYHELEAMGLYGTYYLATDKPDSALQLYQNIYRIAGQNGFVYWKIDVLRSMLRVYVQENNLPGQVSTNQKLIAALDQQIQDNNSFMGDYLKFNEDRDQLAKLRQVAIFQHKEQWVFVIASLAGLCCTALILLAYRRSRKQKKALQLLNKTISDQNQALQANDDFNSRLLSMLAHDFRAPLGQTLAMINILRDEDMDRETQMRFYGQVENSIQHILVTFDNILQWVKRQLSGYQPVPETLALSVLIGQSAEMFRQSITAKSILFNNLVDPEQTVNSDREVIQFVNRNLIHNAVKYSPENGVITVSAKISEKDLTISVRNEGLAMTPEQLQNLFTFRQHESFDRGAGMALTLSREFLDLIGGRIWAESQDGVGTIFFYLLPVS